MPTLTIDDIELNAPDGATILDAARLAGIEIPTLCNLPGHPARPSCMVCVVRVNGGVRLTPSCATIVTDGMHVENHIEDVMRARRTAIELLLSEHLGDCIGPCARVCPAHLDTPRMMRQIEQGQFREALITVKQSIALPAVLGRICPELCEKSCRRSEHDGAVSICQLKRFVADHDMASGDPFIPICAPASGKRVAIAGAGPTGLAAAYYLLQAGHACTLFDERAQAGGLIRSEISEEVLPRIVLDDEIEIIERLGAKFDFGCKIGQDISLDELSQQYDVVLLATGSNPSASENELPVSTGPHGIIVDRPALATNLPGVFAAGAAVTPMRHAVRAVADGHTAAQSIIRYLAGSEQKIEAPAYNFHTGHMPEEELRARMPHDSAYPRLSPRGGDGFSAEEAQVEAARCLQCGCAGAATCRLRELAARCGANQGRFRGDRRNYVLDESHSEVLFEPGKCIACGICVRLASDHGHGFHGHGSELNVGGPFGGGIRESLADTASACAEACPTGALTLRGE